MVWHKVEISTIETVQQKENKEIKIFEYEEVIELIGIGWYNRGLLAALSIGLLGMAIDIFGFSVIVTGCNCDFKLEQWQQSTLLSMPFIGPIVMSIFWGYISDTKGRRKTLLITLWGSFLCSFISAFSPNWIMLAVLKVLSTSFCSAVQSCSYALLSESCASTIRGFYMLILTSALMLFVLSYVVPGFFILQLSFTADLVFIQFTPWRLLTIVLTAPMGISAFLLNFFYESPKFLVNAGREKQALKYLEMMWVRNGKNEHFPVRRVILKEESKATLVKDDKIYIIKSLWHQTVPLFKPPLLWKTLQLTYLTTVIYSINNGLVMWMPYIVEAFTAGVNSKDDKLSRDLCSIITRVPSSNKTSFEDDTASSCSSAIHLETLLSGTTYGILFAGITLAVSKFARMKIIMIAFLLIPLLSTLGAVFNENNIASLVLFVGMTMTNLCVGALFAYYVEFYPTSYLGMATCLSVMVSRLSGLGSVNFLGKFLTTNCVMTFYAFSAYLLSGIAVAAYFLPSDKTKKG